MSTSHKEPIQLAPLSLDNDTALTLLQDKVAALQESRMYNSDCLGLLYIINLYMYITHARARMNLGEHVMHVLIACSMTTEIIRLNLFKYDMETRHTLFVWTSCYLIPTTTSVLMKYF